MSKEVRLSRRDFLRFSAITAIGAALAACAPATSTPAPTKPVAAPTATPKPAEPTKPPAPTATPVPKVAYKEAPMLAELVKAGKLPSVEQRLPQNPPVIKPHEKVGKYGGTWRLGVRGTPHYQVYGMLQGETLLHLSIGGLEILPNLVEKWEVKDAKVFTLYLRKGIKWSDGQPFTADDIIFWHDDIVSNKDLYPTYPVWLMAGADQPKAERLDDYTVRFTYTQVNPFFIRRAAIPFNEAYRARHYLKQFHAKYVDKAELDKKVAEKKFDSWAKLFLSEMSFDTSTGMPGLTAWDLDTYTPEGATHVRNPYYWKVDTEGNQLPYIDKVVTRMAANTAAAQMMVFSGEVDLQQFTPGQFPADTMILKKNEKMGNYHVIDVPISEANVFIFGFNMTHKDEGLRKIFRDKRFRMAMSLAINREDIRQLVYLGQPKEIRQAVALPHSPFYHEKAAKAFTEFDLKKANALLDEMGLTKKDAEGYRLRFDGTPLAITLEVMGHRDDFIDALGMMAKTWKEVGIRATVKPLDVTLYNTRMAGNEVDAGVDYTGTGLYPLLSPTRYIPVGAQNVWAPLWGLWYASKGKSGEEPPAEVKKQLELYDQALVTADEAEQKKLWAQIMDIHAENCFHMGICDRATVPIACSNKFRNVPAQGWDIDWTAGGTPTTNTCQYWIQE